MSCLRGCGRTGWNVARGRHADSLPSLGSSSGSGWVRQLTGSTEATIGWQRERIDPDAQAGCGHRGQCQPSHAAPLQRVPGRRSGPDLAASDGEDTGFPSGTTPPRRSYPSGTGSGSSSAKGSSLPCRSTCGEAATSRGSRCRDLQPVGAGAVGDHESHQRLGAGRLGVQGAFPGPAGDWCLPYSRSTSAAIAGSHCSSAMRRPSPGSPCGPRPPHGSGLMILSFYPWIWRAARRMVRGEGGIPFVIPGVLWASPWAIRTRCSPVATAVLGH